MCKLHNICVDEFGTKKAKTVRAGSLAKCVPRFQKETDHRSGDFSEIEFIDYQVGRGFRSDLMSTSHREIWTDYIRINGLKRPSNSVHRKRKRI